MTLTCEHCGAVFSTRYPSETQTFCSPRCAAHARRPAYCVNGHRRTGLGNCKECARVRNSEHRRKLRERSARLERTCVGSFSRKSPVPYPDGVWAHVVPDHGGCMRWVGQVGKRGYGVWSFSNAPRRYAHRAAYESRVRPLEDWEELHHMCENKLCCNPYHLAPLSRQEHRQAHAAIKASSAA